MHVLAGNAELAGRVYSLLKNWPERRVKAICLTDGERVGGHGDLGIHAIGWCALPCHPSWSFAHRVCYIPFGRNALNLSVMGMHHILDKLG